VTSCGRSAVLLVLGAIPGCAVDVASLRLAAAREPSAEALAGATSQGWRDGEDCRFWLLGVPFGLPQVERAIDDALRPVHGVFMRDVTVYSVHPVYVLYGWHCYRVHGEVFGVASRSTAARSSASTSPHPVQITSSSRSRPISSHE
jgi:hypothetical protein